MSLSVIAMDPPAIANSRVTNQRVLLPCTQVQGCVIQAFHKVP